MPHYTAEEMEQAAFMNTATVLTDEPVEITWRELNELASMLRQSAAREKAWQALKAWLETERPRRYLAIGAVDVLYKMAKLDAATQEGE